MDQIVQNDQLLSAEQTESVSTREKAETEKPKKSDTSFPEPARVPTQAGPQGIKFDFNQGARVVLPAGNWRIRLRDLDTENILFDGVHSSCAIMSSKRFFIRFGIEINAESGETVFTHEYSARDQEILINFPVGTLGDTMGWFPYAVRFQEKHGCKLTCAMSGLIIPLFEKAYPNIKFITLDKAETETFYATYTIGLFFDDAANVWQPTDFRHVGLHRTAGYILGVDPTEARPRIFLEDDTRPIAEPYICIAVQASTQAKKWNNPHGWLDIVQFLKEHGYRVICIDREAVHGAGLGWTYIPYGAEDQTGDKPLAERARWLKHADAFIGLSSGLAWLAWALDCPIVMISGFTHPNNEFETPGRVINWHVCNGCWNDVRLRFDHADFLWCPRHKNTDRMFECTRLITSGQVKRALREVVPALADALT